MGEGRARRPGGPPLSLGQRGSGRVAGIHSPVEWGSEGASTRRTWVAESVRHLRYRRERPRVVCRLVLKSLLCRLAPAQSPGASDGRAARIPGRLVAAPYQGEPVLSALQHPARLPVRGLRISSCPRRFMNSTSSELPYQRMPTYAGGLREAVRIDRRSTSDRTSRSIPKRKREGDYETARVPDPNDGKRSPCGLWRRRRSTVGARPASRVACRSGGQAPAHRHLHVELS